jgi:hypothetical protein
MQVALFHLHTGHFFILKKKLIFLATRTSALHSRGTFLNQEIASWQDLNGFHQSSQ